MTSSTQQVNVHVLDLQTLLSQYGSSSAQQPILFLSPMLPPPTSGHQRGRSPADIANTAQRLREEENACCPCSKYLRECIDHLICIFKGVFKVIGIPLLFMGAALLVYGVIQSATLLVITLSLAELMKSEALIAMIMGMLFFAVGNTMVQGRDFTITPADALYLQFPYMTNLNKI